MATRPFSCAWLAAGLIGALLLPKPAAAVQAGGSSRKRVTVSGGVGQVYAPGSEVPTFFSFPASKGQFTLFRLSEEAMTRYLLGEHGGQVDLTGAAELRSWTEDADRNNPGYFNRQIPVRVQEPGVYAVEARWTGQNGGAVCQVVLVSELSLVVKRGPRRVAVWVLEHATARPQAGAAVNLRFAGGGLLHARTDRNGMAVLTLEKASQTGAMMVASARTDRAWIAEGVGSYGPATAGRTLAWLDRSRYEAGESWHARGVALGPEGRPRANATVALAVRDLAGKALEQRTLRTDAYGAFEAAGRLAETLTDGAYFVGVKCGPSATQVPFAVAPEPDRSFDVRIRPVTDDGLTLEVEARQPLGERVRRGRLTYAVYPRQEIYAEAPQAGAVRELVGEPPFQFQAWSPVERGSTVLDASGKVLIHPERSRIQAGQKYLLVVTVKDAYGRAARETRVLEGPAAVQPATVAGAASPPLTPSAGDGPLSVRADAARYRLGSACTLSVRCSAPGGPALLTVEGDELYRAQVVSLRQGEQEVQLTLTDPRMRLLHVSLLLPRPGGGRHVATLLLPVDPERERLNVSVTPLRSGEYAVRTTDAAGRPVSARVFAELERPWESNLTDPRAGDVARALHPIERNEVVTGAARFTVYGVDLLPWLRADATLGSLTGTPPQGLREAAVSLVTDARGEGVLRLPEAGGAAGARLVVRGIGAGGQAGQAEVATVESEPTGLRLLAPLRLLTGDLAAARVEVWNRTARPRTVTLFGHAEGIELASAARREVKLAAGEQAWLDLGLKATHAGPARVELRVEGGRSADAATLAVVDEPAATAGPAPERTLRRVSMGAVEAVKSGWNGSLSPGEEIEVRLRVPATARDKAVRLVQPVSGGFAVVDADAPAGVSVRRTSGGLEWEWKEAPKAGDEVSCRLRALAPGSWSLGRARLYRGAEGLGTTESVRAAVLELPAPHVLEAARDGDRLRLRVLLRKGFEGPVAATLVGRTLAAGRVTGETRQPVEFERDDRAPREVLLFVPAPDPAKTEGASVEVALEGKGVLDLGTTWTPVPQMASSSRSPLALVLGRQSTRILGQSELVAGAPGALRVIALNTRGGIPLAGAAVRVSFKPKAGQAVPLAQGTTDAHGTLDARFTVPAAQRGEGHLMVECTSALGQETVSREAKIEDRLQMLLSSDKPVYQPGQTIHLRSLSLRKPDLQPLADTPVTLEVTDPKGNKVFKQRGRTSAFGVAAADFTLADEIHLGRYVLRAVAQPEGGPELAVEKTLEIQKYVLPKFKIEVATERPFYLPGERLKGTLQVRYFFGKPVAGGEVELKLSTFVAQWEPIGTIKGKTTVDGEFSFEQDLPRHFVGQPLQAGNAVLLVEAAVTDPAQHRETRNHSLTVSANPINVAVIPESGTLAPGLENRVYVVATYPDGKPAAGARFRLSGPGLPEGGAAGKTDAAGMAHVAITPTEAGQDVKLKVEAADDKGNQTREEVTVKAGDRLETVLLRTDRAVYEVGQAAKLDVLSTSARGTVYVDVVRNRQTVLTRTLDLEGGRASTTVPLDTETAGTLEFRAYRILPNGEMARDTRIAYVNPANDLKIQVSSDQETYRPGSPASLRLRVTDRDGHPVMAALGVNIVDESVFALQELQPGLERVYFLLEKELLEPRYEIHWDSPGMGVFDKPVDPAADARRQELARVMFAAVEMAHDYSLQVNTGDDRAAAAQRRADHARDAVVNAIHNGSVAQARETYYVQHHELPETDIGLAFYTGKDRPLKAEDLRDPWDQPLVVRTGEPSPDSTLPLEVCSAGPDGVLNTEDDVRAEGQVQVWSYLPPSAQRDLQQVRVTKLGGLTMLGAVDSLQALEERSSWAISDREVLRGFRQQGQIFAFGGRAGGGGLGGGFGGFGDVANGPMAPAGSPVLLAAPARSAAASRMLRLEDRSRDKDFAKAAKSEVEAQVPADAPANEAAGPAPVRVREYFPETLYANPALVTDADGRAQIDLETADSITTWRLTALANSRAGQLGSVTAPIRVFQDFFVDLDLPVALTQNDEVQVPVAVYNYLPAAQKVRLRLQLGDEDKEAGPAWFELVGGDPAEKTVELQKDQVSVVHFRVKARKPGVHRFTVFAQGSQLSDAVRRQVEVTPDGQEVRRTINDRLEKTTTATVTLPQNAIPGSEKLLVKLYPGVFSQVVEGLDAIFRMPNGCFEQTTSTTYPNVLVLDYLKRAKKINPEVQMKAQEYINIGYQRLLTFNAPDGGFSLWPGGQPETFLTAFGLLEMSDMAKVHEVDPNVIARAQKWLLAKQQANGSWPVSPTAHQERASASGVYAFTAYATWALSETARENGSTDVQQAVRRGAGYLRDHLDDAKDPYVFALAANALVALDPQDAVTRRVVEALAGKAKEDDRTAWWSSAEGAAFTEARGQTADIETTALAAYVLIRSRGHGALASKALTYLIRSKDSYGTWATTQPTVLAMKALIASLGSSLEDNQGAITVKVNGKEVRTLQVTADNSDVVQQLDVTEAAKPGANRIELAVSGKISALYQVVERHYVPWDQAPPVAQGANPLAIQVTYDKTDLSLDDTLTAQVKLTYTGTQAPGQVMVDLGIPPGFNVMSEDLAEARGSGLIQRFEVTGRQVLLYIEKLVPGKPIQLRYRMKARFPVRARTPRSTAYEYYAPDVAAVARPVELVVR